MMAAAPGSPAASIIVPAHNEERSIGRLLDALAQRPAGRSFQVLVMCNGCTDGTADVARGRGVDVVELPRPSKREAMREGDRLAHAYPRVFVDADVEITGHDVSRLVDAVTEGGYLASGPHRLLPRDGVATLVRWYYDVWEALPQVRSGLFGRGVIALAEEGSARVRILPSAMSDDLVFSEAFAPQERTVVEDAVVVVRPPKTLGDLLRRRVRVSTGNVQAEVEKLRTPAARTSSSGLVRLVRDQPRLAPKVPVFLAVTLAARLRARRALRAGDFTTWQRDESSRT